FFRLQIFPAGLAEKHPVLDFIALGVAGPTGEVLAVEEILPLGRLEDGERAFRGFAVGIGFGGLFLGRGGAPQKECGEADGPGITVDETIRHAGTRTRSATRNNYVVALLSRRAACRTDLARLRKPWIRPEFPFVFVIC